MDTVDYWSITEMEHTGASYCGFSSSVLNGGGRRSQDYHQWLIRRIEEELQPERLGLNLTDNDPKCLYCNAQFRAKRKDAKYCCESHRVLACYKRRVLV